MIGFTGGQLRSSWPALPCHSSIGGEREYKYQSPIIRSVEHRFERHYITHNWLLKQRHASFLVCEPLGQTLYNPQTKDKISSSHSTTS